jgi:thiol-disulfide isomerase/thioredoxin
MSRLLRIALIPALLGVAFTGADEDGWERLNEPAAKFSVADTNGVKLSEKAFEGKVVVVDFWATWCGPCVTELPALARFAAKVKDRKDVAFYSFSVDDDKADVVKFFADRKEKFPVYMAEAVGDKMGVIIFPTKLIIDGRKGAPGHVRLRKEGVIAEGELEDRIAEVLKK